MRKYINKILYPFGYELKRIDRFALLLGRLLRSTPGVKFVQVGANDGVRFDGLYATVTAHRCAGLVIEPLPDMFKRLQFNYADYPVIAVNKAVHATAKSMDLYRASPDHHRGLPDWASGLASFNREHLLTHGVPEGAISVESVHCASLMEILIEHRCLDANLLQIDTEGYDAEVLRMIDFDRFRPQLIKYEHKNLSLLDRHGMVTLLTQRGYRVKRQGEDTIAWW